MYINPQHIRQPNNLFKLFLITSSIIDKPQKYFAFLVQNFRKKKRYAMEKILVGFCIEIEKKKLIIATLSSCFGAGQVVK